jgi:leucyl-tRNA synthetase
MLFNGKVMASDGSAFSKSKGNGIDPLEIIAQGYGADALRTYLMFAAPLELVTRWDPQGVPGAYRFLVRLWNIVHEYIEADDGELDGELAAQLRRSTHLMIRKVTDDIEHDRYNTAIAAAMERLNELYKQKTSRLVRSRPWQEALESLVACIAPFAPHIADELWQQLGRETSVQRDSWPRFDSTLIARDEVTLAVQVNGKLRGKITVAPDLAEPSAFDAALAVDTVRAAVGDAKIRRVVYVPGRILNIVV